MSRNNRPPNPIPNNPKWTTPIAEDLQKNDLIRHKKRRRCIASITTLFDESILVRWQTHNYTEIPNERLHAYETPCSRDVF